MRTAIVYCSQTGHTEKYARWLADDLECPVYPYCDRARVDLEPVLDCIGSLQKENLDE